MGTSMGEGLGQSPPRWLSAIWWASQVFLIFHTPFEKICKAFHTIASFICKTSGNHVKTDSYLGISEMRDLGFESASRGFPSEREASRLLLPQFCIIEAYYLSALLVQV